MANQTAQTAHQTILQHSNPENGTTCYSHAGCIINPFLAVVAKPHPVVKAALRENKPPAWAVLHPV